MAFWSCEYISVCGILKIKPIYSANYGGKKLYGKY